MTLVDPACNVNYCSFYIKGLYDLYGRHNVAFRSNPFKALRYNVNTHCFAFFIDGKKYVIDYADSNEVFYDEFLLWADVYGKVNYNMKFIPKEYKSKIVRVGPNFGIGCFGNNKWQAIWNCLKSYLKARPRLDMSISSFLSPYLWLYKRAGVFDHEPTSVVGSKTIFMVSHYWNGEEDANQYRINFIRACKRLQKERLIDFIGGMVPSECDTKCPDDVIIKREIPMNEYIGLMKKSLLVFNTPAVHKCHGWKLPEYLSQGKIILSTHFVNELPVNLEHGKNIYYTESNENSIYDSVKHIVLNIELQKKLEIGSLEYWNTNANPGANLRKLITMRY